VSRLQQPGEATDVQMAAINKGSYNSNYQLAMALLVIDFTYFEGRDGELVVKEWGLPILRVTGSHHISSRDRTVGKKYLRFLQDLTGILITVVIGMKEIYHIRCWKLFCSEKHH
jgi:hypothetical protein